METVKDKRVEEQLMEDNGEDMEDVEKDHGKKRAAAPSTVSGRNRSAGGGGSSQSCQVDNCTTDMSDAKQRLSQSLLASCQGSSSFNCRTQAVLLSAMRFHDLSEFNEAKRCCRKRLAGLRSSYEIPEEGNAKKV